MERAARRNGEYARYADRRETEKKGSVCTTKKGGGMEREMQHICRAKKGERKGGKYAKVTNATTREAGREGGASDRSLS